MECTFKNSIITIETSMCEGGPRERYVIIGQKGLDEFINNNDCSKFYICVLSFTTPNCEHYEIFINNNRHLVEIIKNFIKKT